MKFAPEEIELALGAFQKIDNEAAWKAVVSGVVKLQATGDTPKRIRMDHSYGILRLF